MIAPAKDLDGFRQARYTYDVSSWRELIKDGWSKKHPAIWAIWPCQTPVIKDGNHRLQAAIESSPDVMVPVVMICQRKLWHKIYEKVLAGYWEWEGNNSF